MDNPLKIEFNRTHRLAICRPVGLFGPEHVGQLLNFLFAFESTDPEKFNRLLDLSQVTELQLSDSTIYEYAMARREATAQLPPFHTAIIASDPSAEAVALAYAQLMEDSNIQVGIFRDTTSAADWLRVPESVFYSEIAKQE